MTTKGLKLIYEGNANVDDLTELIINNLNCELVYMNYQEINGVRVTFVCFEKYFFRNNSYAGLSLLITESNLIQTIDVVGFGGGEGLFNLSWGANEDYLQKVVTIIKEKGFKETQ